MRGLAAAAFTVAEGAARAPAGARSCRSPAASFDTWATGGPFVESKEVIGGYAILRASSREEAIALGTRFLDAHARALGPSCQTELEIRPLFGPEDGG